MSDEKGCREAFEKWGTSLPMAMGRATEDDFEVFAAGWSARPAPQVEDLVKALEDLIGAIDKTREVSPGWRLSVGANYALNQARAALAAYRKD